MSSWCVLFMFWGCFFRRICWQCAVFTKAVQTSAWIDTVSDVVLAMNETLRLKSLF